MSGSPATVRGHVLVAEDNPVLAQLLTCQLIDAGYQVTCIADGQEVVDRIESVNPSLMVLDL